MSFKLALLFVVCFLALAGAIPVEKTEDQDTKQPQPVAADLENEAPEEDPVSEGNEDEDENENEDQSEEDTNDEEKENEEETESDDNEDEQENELEAKGEDENDEVKRGRRKYHPQCKIVRRRVRKCRWRLRCHGISSRGRGRCCRKYRRCRFQWQRYKVCKHCRLHCKKTCSYRKICVIRRCFVHLGKLKCRNVRPCFRARLPKKCKFHNCYARCQFVRHG